MIRIRQILKTFTSVQTKQVFYPYNQIKSTISMSRQISRQILLQNYELYQGVPGLTGVIEKLKLSQLVSRYPHMDIDINNLIREDMERVKRAVQTMNRRGKFEILEELQMNIEKTVQNACLFVSRILSQTTMTLSAVFDGDLPLLGHDKEESKMWYDSFQKIRRQIVDRIAAYYLSFNVGVISAPEEGDHQIIKDYREDERRIDIVCSQDKIFIHNKIPTLIQLRPDGTCYVIDVKKWQPQKIVKPDLRAFLLMLSDPYKVALFQAVRCNSKYNRILKCYSAPAQGQVRDREEEVKLKVRSQCVQKTKNIEGFFQAVKKKHPNVEITEDYRQRTKNIVILHLFAWCYSRRKNRLEFLNPELLQEGVYTQQEIYSVIGRRTEYDCNIIVKRLKTEGLYVEGASTAKLRRERLEFCSKGLMLDYEYIQQEANDFFYRAMHYFEFQIPVENLSREYPRMAIDLLQGVSQTLEKIQEQFRRLGHEYRTFLAEIEHQINEDCIKEILLNVYLLQKSKVQVIGFIDAQKYANRSNLIESEYSKVEIDYFWKKFVKMVMLAVERLGVEVRFGKERDIDYQILDSYKNNEVDAVYCKKEIFVLHKVPIVYNYQKRGQIHLTVVDLNRVTKVENQWAEKFKGIANNPKKRAFYASLKKCLALEEISTALRRFVYQRKLEELASNCETLQQVIEYIKNEHFSHIYLSNEQQNRIESQMKEIYDYQLAFSRHRLATAMTPAKVSQWRACFFHSDQSEYQRSRFALSPVKRQAILMQLLKKKFLFITSMALDTRTINLAVAEQPIDKLFS